MSVTDWFVIRTLTIPSSWIAVLAALLLTGVVLWKRFGKETEDMYSDAAILFLLVWKLSIILTDFSMVWKSPISILYFNGGSTGIYLGLIAGIARIIYVLYKKNFAEKKLAAMVLGMIMVQALYQFSMVLLNDGAFWQKAFTIIAFSLLLYFAYVKSFWSHVWRVQLTVLLLVGHFVVAFSQPEGVLQTPFIVTILMATASYVVLKRFEGDRNSFVNVQVFDKLARVKTIWRKDS